MNKKEKARRLYDAIGEIDEEIIADAEKKDRSSALRRIIKPLVAAACALLILVCSLPPLINFMIEENLNFGDAPDNGADSFPAPGDTSPNENPPDGSISGPLPDSYTVHIDGASLTVIGHVGEKYSFKLNITKEQEDVSVFIRGSGADGFGNEIFVISTTRGYAELTHIPLPPPTITVNGEITDALPVAPGEYLITVDLGSLDSAYAWDTYFTFTPFGNILRK